MRRPIFKTPSRGDGGTTFVGREGTRDIASFPFGWNNPISDMSSGTQEV